MLMWSDVRGWFMGVFELGSNIIISVSAWNQILTSISRRKECNVFVHIEMKVTFPQLK